MNGTTMAREMNEQPARLRELIGRFPAIAEQVRAATPQPLDGITVAARGSSDNAAIYGRYLLEATTGRPVSLAAPSLHTLYGIHADYRGQLAIAVSQSGATPEIVHVLQALQAAGGRGLAITNEPRSPLALAASTAVGLEVGEELAVPATKTVTGEFAAFAMVAAALGEAPFDTRDLEAVPRAVQEVLEDPEPVATAAAALEGASHMIVVARGYLFPAALEIALKLKETCALFADGYSAADLRHGPIAAVTGEVRVIALCVPGPAWEDVSILVRDLRAREVPVLIAGPGPDCALPLPGQIPEPLAPIAAVVRGQQLALELARRLGYDPDQPPGLTKVTGT